MFRKLQKSIAFLICISAIFLLQACKEKDSESNNIPKFNQGEAYGLVRNSLVKSGWSPVTSEDADKCINGDVRCKNRPEMEACSGSGLAPCKFVWRRKNYILHIFTVGVDATNEGDAAFDSYELINTEHKQ